MMSGKSRGAIAVEFTAALLILLPLLAGVVDVARLMFTDHLLQRAAREGAVLASRSTDPATINADVLQIVRGYFQGTPLIDPGRVSISLQPSPFTSTTGTLVTLAVSYNMEDFAWLPWHSFIPGDLTITAQARHE
jgi:Flp pilus assembly protein TadG